MICARKYPTTGAVMNISIPYSIAISITLLKEIFLFMCMARYIDVHCHLDDAKFESDLDEVVARAKEKDILIVHSGINPTTNKLALELAKKYNLYCTFGVYPIDAILKDFPDVTDDYPRDIESFAIDDALDWIEEHKESCIGIGEVGLEFKVIEATSAVRDAQISNFKKIITLSQKLDLPLIIHSRGGELECTEIMEDMKCTKVVMHSFNGKKSLIKRGVANGWFFSVPPVITRLEHFTMMVKLVPLEQLLTETDAPYLSPVYATRNEPANVTITVKKIAEIKEMDEEVVRKQLLANAQRLFNLSL